MTQIKRLALICSMAIGLTACTIGQTTAPGITRVNVGDPTYGKLQLAVGTANIFGTLTGLNVVSTLRQANGTSATGVNTPAITGPITFTATAVPAAGGALADPYTALFNNGPSLPETTAGTAITGTPQSVHIGTPFCDIVGVPPPTFTSCPPGIAPNTTTFGQSGGVFAMGLAPYNHVAATGQSYSYVPYPQPMYHQSLHPQFLPWGGPPAFDPDGDSMGTRDGLIPSGTDSFNFPFFLGVGEGITVFEGVTPHAATPYTLSVQIGFLSTTGTPQVVTLTANAQMGSLALLPTVTAPVVTPNATDGGATFTVTLPCCPQVTEAYVQIVDYGPVGGPNNANAHNPNCQGPKGTAFAPVYYTVHVTASGPVALAANHGPNTSTTGGLTPSPTICTAAQNNTAGITTGGDNFTVQMIGFDYPAYQAAVGLTQPGTPQAPAITGPGGQSDITISIPVEQDAPGYAPVPLAISRRPFEQPSLNHVPLSSPANPDIYRKLGIPER